MNPKPSTAAAVLGLIAASGVSGQTFVGLGLPPGGTQSNAEAISADGSIVVGQTNTASNSQVPFRWTAQTGMVLLDMPPASGGLPHGVSSGGAAVIGTVQDALCVAAIWTAGSSGWPSGGALRALGVLPGGSESWGNAVSTDGLTVVGDCSFASTGRGWRWTQAHGMESLGVLPGGTSSGATGVSGDGSVIVGNGNQNGYAPVAFRWTQSGGIQSLGLQPGGHFSNAHCVSGDGAVIVGQVDTAATPWQNRVFRWTQSGGMVVLGVLPGHRDAFGLATNLDGSVIVGSSDHDAEVRAFLWTAALGMVDLNVYLPSQGVSLSGWRLSHATGVSADGRTIVGGGAHNGHPEGWVATLGSCYANCDQSTAMPTLNVGDFVCFMAKFAAGHPYANCDGSSVVPMLNVADFVCFQQRFAAGCP